ncbi:MAG: hypothetical protein RJA14_1681, partial [Pseudomonadota bacterium]
MVSGGGRRRRFLLSQPGVNHLDFSLLSRDHILGEGPRLGVLAMS